MTIDELLSAIAQSDALPSKWRVTRQAQWILVGAAEPKRTETVAIEYEYEDKGYQSFGEIEISDGVYGGEWIERIIVDRGVPAGVFAPLTAAASRVTFELRPVPEIPF